MRRTITLISTMGVALLLASGAALFSSFGSGGPPTAEAQTTPPDETLSGVFSVLWGDPRPGSGQESEIKYILTDDQGQKTELLLDQRTAKQPGGPLALNGKRVKVQGTSVSDDRPLEKVRVQEIRFVRSEDAAQAASGEPGRALSGSQPWVTIGCRFADSTGVTPYPQSWFQTLMGTTNPGMDHYWRELSFNNINLTGGQVVAWFNLPQPRSFYLPGGQLDHARIANDCTAAADASVFFPNFKGINLMFNDNLDGAAWGGGLSLTRDGQTKPYSMTWMPPWGYENQGVLGQEMGHGFGLPHSSGPYSTPYDSDWDVMSSAFGVCSSPHSEYGCVGVHTIAFHKDQMGWIPPARKYTAALNSDQSITLERLGVPASTSGYLMAQIPIAGSSTQFYTVESRRVAGYDNQIPGEAVVIHKVNTTLSDRNAQVVDTTNDSNPNDAGARWLPGETFMDTANGISVQVIGTTASGYTVRIKNGTATPPLQTYQENDQARVGYADWWFYKNTSFSGGYSSYSNAAGNAAIFRFSGTSIAWKTQKLSDAGITDVYLDGVKVKTFDGYSASPLFNVTGYSKTGLANRAHTLKLVVTGRKNASSSGTYTEIDRFMVGSTSYQENSFRVVYGPWSGAASTSASGGTYRYSGSTKPAYFYYFSGPQVNLFTAKGPSRGNARVQVIDAATGVVAKDVLLNLNAATVQWKVKQSITGLDASKSYYLKVFSTDGKPVVVDAYEAVANQAQQPLLAADGQGGKPEVPEGAGADR